MAKAWNEEKAALAKRHAEKEAAYEQEVLAKQAAAAPRRKAKIRKLNKSPICKKTPDFVRGFCFPYFPDPSFLWKTW
jgi:hypothetical protein